MKSDTITLIARFNLIEFNKDENYDETNKNERQKKCVYVQTLRDTAQPLVLYDINTLSIKRNSTFDYAG